MKLWPQIKIEQTRLDADIAIVTSNVMFAGQLTSALTVIGASVHCAENYRRLFRLADGQGFDCVILDIGPSVSAVVEACRRLRPGGSKGVVPVIVMGENLGELDRIAVYEAGAEVVLTAPISGRELVARVRNILWRTRPLAVVPQLKLGSMAVDLDLEKVSCCGSPVHLRPKELRLLKFFMRHPARVISRQELAAGLYRDTQTDSRTIDQHVCRLRQALHCSIIRDPIRTVLKEGYVLDRDVLAGAPSAAPEHVDRRRRQLKA